MRKCSNFYDSIDSIISGLTQQKYIVSRKAATAIFLAGRLGKPLLIEGPAGVGKTALAGAVAGALGTELYRLQCYPGLDDSKALYEWNYQKQLLHIQMYGKEIDIFTPEYLLERPLLKALRAARQVVLLIDEIDKGEEELESFLLEALSEFQVTIPELGAVTATHRPYVIMTSNSTRQLSDALKRRSLYLYLAYPDSAVEEAIIHLKVPGVSRRLAQRVVEFVQGLRKLKLTKAPSITETIDWARTLLLLGREDIDAELVHDSLNVLLKYEEDILIAESKLNQLVPEKSAGKDQIEQHKSVQSTVNNNELAKFDF